MSRMMKLDSLGAMSSPPCSDSRKSFFSKSPLPASSMMLIVHSVPATGNSDTCYYNSECSRRSPTRTSSSPTTPRLPHSAPTDFFYILLSVNIDVPGKVDLKCSRKLRKVETRELLNWEYSASPGRRGLRSRSTIESTKSNGPAQDQHERHKGVDRVIKTPKLLPQRVDEILTRSESPVGHHDGHDGVEHDQRVDLQEIRIE